MSKHLVRRSRFGRKAFLGGAMAVVVAGGTGAALAANAAESDAYDQAQLLASCTQFTDLYGQADRCRFEPASYDGFTGNLEQVSGVDTNCGTVNVTHAVTWLQSKTESNSIEVSASVEAQLSKIFSVSVSTTFSHSWEQTSSKSDTITMTIPPLSSGVIFRGAPLAKVTGRMVINFRSRRQGHFEWYAYPTLTVPAEDQPNLARIVVTTRPLTDTEKAACPTVPGGSKQQVNVPPEAQTVVQTGEDPATQTAGSLNLSEQHSND